MGPYSLDQACQMLVEGKLHTWDLCWPDGAREWIALDSIPTIADKAIAIRDQRRAEALASAQAAASTSPNAPNPQFVDLQPDDPAAQHQHPLGDDFLDNTLCNEVPNGLVFDGGRMLGGDHYAGYFHRPVVFV
mgnify:CR=1 FL=1